VFDIIFLAAHSLSFGSSVYVVTVVILLILAQ
jgi:hypothetical protein